MITLHGKVLTVIRHAESTSKDGEKREAYNQVQLLTTDLTRDGQERMGVQTLTTARPDEFEALSGRDIAVTVGAYAKGQSVGFYMAPNTLPLLPTPTL
jgi:hypothetical protein